MELLFIPQLVSALVVVPCAVVWGREREGYEVKWRKMRNKAAMEQIAKKVAPVSRAAGKAMRGAARVATKMADVTRDINQWEDK